MAHQGGIHFFVYMLRCSDGSYYVGHTDDLETRVVQHQHGALGGYTATRRPVALVWSAEFASRDQAFLRELQLKRWSRAKKEALIRDDWSEIGRLGRGPDRSERVPAVPRLRPAEGRATLGMIPRLRPCLTARPTLGMSGRSDHPLGMSGHSKDPLTLSVGGPEARRSRRVSGKPNGEDPR
ncbi:GIY-YIG nuclease family protein [Anaeromyxobacter dehalogenans]|uniref:Excinuclease ABC, C subunit-like protein n=1 Tax=Anaeromyxobacter dehalogenans (strain 2CP-C) TaxID=290397 RepID=Q2IHH6_ANADE|nr:GIY-YIG nuclease family protein [Anaeromyxobacter dehalogenans]ABC84031.1 Excinuclease ABC, C subunit-like protein [Anaeromyxobacter dehalogenans 2CP-C]